MTSNKSSFLKEKQTQIQKQPDRGDTHLASGFCFALPCLCPENKGAARRDLGAFPDSASLLGLPEEAGSYWYGFLFQGDGPVGPPRLPTRRNLRPREVMQLPQRHTAGSPLNPICGTPSLGDLHCQPWRLEKEWSGSEVFNWGRFCPPGDNLAMSQPGEGHVTGI